MKLHRRAVLRGGMAAALVLPRWALAASITDSAGRVVRVPARVERIFAAGPPAAIQLYTFAPDLLLGWTHSHSPEQCQFLGEGACAKPEVGRLTGRGNSTNLEVLLQLKPDLVLDIGTISDTYVSLADRVQGQTGIPYALLDGRYEATAQAYRQLGELTHLQQRGEEFARYVDDTVRTIKARVDAVPTSQRPRVYYGILGG